jgi:outer membrane protein OmpA-like peptidoglycan-associated protein
MTLAAAAVMVASLLPVRAEAQDLERSRFIASSDVLSSISMFNYQERRTSDLIFRATPVISTGEGKAEIQYENGNAQISAEVRRLPPPTALGPYTTYVLWTLTPDGRAANEGVFTGAEGGNGALETQHAASQFALIVTAEPHFAVSAPSTMVVMYNVADKVRGAETKVSSLFERADYSTLATIEPDERPIELVQAEYSVAIAKAAGAEEFVPNKLSVAQSKLDAARAAWGSRGGRDRKTAPGIAREAVIAGEDARRAALVARVDADARAKNAAAAEAAAAAERERAAAAAAAERQRAEAAAAAERERAAAAAEAERQRAAAAAAEAALATQAAVERAARLAAEEADARATARARAELLNRLSAVLPTRETERGLVSEIGGVQFATGTANLNPPARESLARFSGIVASYPELRFRIEGHTDNVGSDATNSELSLRRALSVRDYLTSLGVAATRIDVDGFGPSRPVADNTTADGRARNRRVEIVISGGMLTAGNR